MTTFLQGREGDCMVSDLCAAEVTSAISRLVRTKRLSEAAASEVLNDFDRWRARLQSAPISSLDISHARDLLWRFDLKLRAPDAIHISACRRLGCELATLDGGLADAARAIDLSVVDSFVR